MSQCTFCGSEDVYIAFPIPGEWQTCANCHLFIVGEDWEKIRWRMLRRYRDEHPKEMDVFGVLFFMRIVRKELTMFQIERDRWNEGLY